ncbi:hypothetical protein B0920_14035 [Massilia sp. KIM]|uniref:hypothetical protein n=1 Tax=Massilia sp. KIM TaxID=1955422 RepID=UPI00098ECD57|nr:hypothetical protein [Massilia sp. KIM]OON64771.1 hypothetical protein B0920_14035 [Massilia sp. KIM]
MLRSTTRYALLTLCLLAQAGVAGAQQQPPSQEPPKLDRIEPGSDVPATTIPGRERTRITEKRQGGQVTEVEVQSGPSRYIMKPNVAPGNAQPGDAQSSAIRAPQWQVMEFDIGNPKKQGATEQPVAPAPAKPGAPARADVPPPPPLEPAPKK